MGSIGKIAMALGALTLVSCEAPPENKRRDKGKREQVLATEESELSTGVLAGKSEASSDGGKATFITQSALDKLTATWIDWEKATDEEVADEEVADEEVADTEEKEPHVLLEVVLRDQTVGTIAVQIYRQRGEDPPVDCDDGESVGEPVLVDVADADGSLWIEDWGFEFDTTYSYRACSIGRGATVKPATEDDPTATVTTPTACGGRRHAGGCWYQTEPGESCTGFCAERGGDDPLTAEYTGFPAPFEQCAEVIKLYHPDWTATQDITCGMPGDANNAGCMPNIYFNIMIRCKQESLPEKASGYPRMCACKE